MAPRPRASGSILLVTLWLIAILAVAAAALAGYLSTETRLLRYRTARIQARLWARSGVYLGMQRVARELADAANTHEWLGQAWAGEWTLALPLENASAASGGRMTVRIVDEERQLNVNRLEDPGLSAMAGRLLGQAEPVDLIADYVDAEATPRAGGLERRTGSPPYQAKNAPAVAIEELLMIPGLTAASYRAVQSHYSAALEDASTVNINTADVAVLRALFETVDQPGLADEVVAYRWDPGDAVAAAQGSRFSRLRPEVETVGAPLNPRLKQALTEVMVGPIGTLLDVRSTTFHITVTVQLTTPAVRYHAEACVRRLTAAPGADVPAVEIADVPLQVLAWREG